MFIKLVYLDCTIELLLSILNVLCVEANPLSLSTLMLLLFLAQQPPVGQGLLIHEVFRSHTTTRHSREDSSGRVISSSQRPLPDNTQHSQQTDIHAPGVIRNHNLSRRAAADLRLRPRGHWDRPINRVVGA
jgi:hypothetical protein